MELFDMVNETDNLKLCSLTRSDLLDLKESFDNYLLEYKKKLNIDYNFTFGFEIEFSFKDDHEFQSENIYKTWKLVDEPTVEDGKEINSPILHDSNITWSRLKIICDYLNETAFITQRCGSHIHIGNQIFESKENVQNFLLLWSVYENICSRFFCGEYNRNRPLTVQFACPIANLFLLDDGETFFNIPAYNMKFMGVSLGKKRIYNKFGKDNTTEIRVPNGTINPIIWQNNVYFLYKLIEYAKSNNFDIDLINYRNNIGFVNDIYSLNRYMKINYNQVFGVADLIFDNNYDKVYFLKQYFKDYKNDDLKYKKVKQFTKYGK